MRIRFFCSFLQRSHFHHPSSPSPLSWRWRLHRQLGSSALTSSSHYPLVYGIFRTPFTTDVCGKGLKCKGVRLFSKGHQQTNQWNSSSQWRSANRNTLMYVVAVAIAVTGLSYAAVPLYRIFCQATGYGGTVVKVDTGKKIEEMKPIEERELTIRCMKYAVHTCQPSVRCWVRKATVEPPNKDPLRKGQPPNKGNSLFL